MYRLVLNNDYAHAAEHALYVATAVLVRAPVLGLDPLPHRAGPRGRLLCMVACMLPMAAIAAWLGSASGPVYSHVLGAATLNDQRLAATIMWLGCPPALAVFPLSVERGQRRAPA